MLPPLENEIITIQCVVIQVKFLKKTRRIKLRLRDVNSSNEFDYYIGQQEMNLEFKGE